MKTQLIIFGITGDLSRRKLLPALQNIISSEELDISIVGVSRRKTSSEELVAGYNKLKGRTSIFTMDLSEASEYLRLADHLSKDPDTQRLYYLAVPPGAAASIADFLGEAGLNSQRDKILFEKPFGFDEVSAREFIDRTHRYFNEDQIFRIDHYMTKNIALDILRLRREAGSRHNKWNSSDVSGVEIIAHETIGIEGRGEFYEQTGAIRDVIQGHLMQLLSLVLMKPPSDINNIPYARLVALNNLLPVDPKDVKKDQYKGYPEEVGVTRSKTETFARLTLYSEDPEWEGVPLVLETGKKMPEKKTIIKISYYDGTEDLFDESTAVSQNDNKLIDAYERVILSAIDGDHSVFTSSDEVIASWQVLDPAQYVA